MAAMGGSQPDDRVLSDLDLEFSNLRTLVGKLRVGLYVQVIITFFSLCPFDSRV